MEVWTFGCGDGTAIAIQRGYCEFELHKVTDNLIPKMNTLKELLSKGLIFCGSRMEGKASREVDAIPSVTFLPLDNAS